MHSNEYKILEIIDHTSIIKFHDFIDEMRNIHQITELAIGQSFATFVKEHKTLPNKSKFV